MSSREMRAGKHWRNYGKHRNILQSAAIERYDLRQGYLIRTVEETTMAESQEEIKKIVQQMKHQEARIRMYAVMRQYLQPESKGGMLFISSSR